MEVYHTICELTTNLKQKYLHKLSLNAFSRKRILTLEIVVALVLSLTRDSKENGFDIIISKFFQELHPEPAERPSVTSSALSQRRKQIPYEIFEGISHDLASRIERNFQETSLWNGLKVYAIDTTTITLPNSEEIASKFQTHATYGRSAYYPQAKVLVGMNLMNGAIPFLAISSYEVNDHSILKANINKIPENSLTIGDRGFSGHEIFILFEDNRFYLLRAKAGTVSHAPVRIFLRSGQKDAWVIFKNRDKKHADLEVRLICAGKDKEGSDIVLATNLPMKYSSEDLKELYLKRWMIETLFNRAKNILKIEKFHSMSINGIKQEIFAWAITSMMSYGFAKTANDQIKEKHMSCSVKMAIELTKLHLLKLLFSDMETLKTITKDIVCEVLKTVYRVRYARKFPRMSKQPVKRWSNGNQRTEALKNQIRPQQKSFIEHYGIKPMTNHGKYFDDSSDILLTKGLTVE
ncbi:MAG: IS4 family transposase [Oligoflexia bacterium]|nr:IS4 family transposase [Oligoflexia bacterium]